MRRLNLIIMCLVLMLSAAVFVSAATITVPKYTVIPVVLDDTISSASSRAGNTFTCHVKDNKTYGFPSGTFFTGYVKEAYPKHGSTPGKMIISFTKATLPSGKTVRIQAVPSSKSGIKSGEYSGKRSNSDSVKKGAIIGGGLGLIFGKNLKGTLIGGALGAGAGYLLKNKTGDVELKEGSSFYITLTKPVKVPTN